MSHNPSQGLINLLSNLNRFSTEEAIEKGCLPFYIASKQVGLIRPDFWSVLQPFSDVFVNIDPTNKSGEFNTSCQERPGVHLVPELDTPAKRTKAVNVVLEKLRADNAVKSLQGWRHENYRVSPRFGDEPLMEVERAAAGMFGFVSYGVHINGFTKDDNGQYMIWIGRRSKTKPTFPDMFDNMCAGGLSSDLGVTECARKECQEEASVSDSLLDQLKFVGTVSYFYEDERGLSPECQFVYDLQVPEDFKPVNADGEVGSFQKMFIPEMLQLMTGGHFKPNCAAVCLDFMVRHGLIDPDKDPNVSYYVEQCMPLYKPATIKIKNNKEINVFHCCFVISFCL